MVDSKGEGHVGSYRWIGSNEGQALSLGKGLEQLGD
jgi:hypothetical protein